eukprot:jgi/Chlat1/1070/Chrsp110S01577
MAPLPAGALRAGACTWHGIQLHSSRASLACNKGASLTAARVCTARAELSSASSSSSSSRTDGDDDEAQAQIQSGHVEIITGPMFAGKTSALLQRMKDAAVAGRRILLVKSSKDTRYARDNVVAHNGTRMPCFALPSLTLLPRSHYAEAEVIGIDEAQFFPDLLDFCRLAADYDGKRLVVAGLDGDFQRRIFGAITELVPMADSVTKLAARCSCCGERAPFTLRTVNDDRTELIGGQESYMPVCRRHYVDGARTMQILKARAQVSSSSRLELEGVATVT